MTQNRIYLRIIKPWVDKLIAVVVLILAFPFMILAMIALAVANRGEIWFLQERPGIHGKIFKVIKFKTMNDAKDERGLLLSDEKRLTVAGKIIRKTSLDEVPQLINVLRGEMSVVGPRPLLTEYLLLYSPEQQRRHEVLPGITGWAQVNGRNAISWKEKFAYDVWYVDHISLGLDIKIIFLTIVKVFKAEGITSTTSATTEKFRGNN